MRTGARGGGAGLSSATGQVDPGPAPPCLLGGFADQSSVFSRPVGPCAPARSSQSAAAALQSDGGRDWPDTLGGCRGRLAGRRSAASCVKNSGKGAGSYRSVSDRQDAHPVKTPRFGPGGQASGAAGRLLS